MTTIPTDPSTLIPRLTAAYQQLAYLWNDTGSCPCGARRESPRTYPHALSCPTAFALAWLEPREPTP